MWAVPTANSPTIRNPPPTHRFKMPIFKPHLVLSSPFSWATTDHFRPKEAPQAKATSPNRCKVCIIQIREPKKNSRQAAKPPGFMLASPPHFEREGPFPKCLRLASWRLCVTLHPCFLGRSRFLSRQNDNCRASDPAPQNPSRGPTRTTHRQYRQNPFLPNRSRPIPLPSALCALLFSSASIAKTPSPLIPGGRGLNTGRLQKNVNLRQA